MLSAVGSENAHTSSELAGKIITSPFDSRSSATGENDCFFEDISVERLNLPPTEPR